MISKKRNTEFLLRINKILGNRAKHPWGRSLGLRNSRIDSMFRGVVPQVDALERIRRVERVNLDWLISGEGAPYRIPIFRDDTASSEALRERLQGGGDYRLYVVAAGTDAAVVLTLPVVVDYEDGTEASFIDLWVYVPAADQTLAVAADWRDRWLVRVDADVLARLRAGYLGPRDLLGEGKGGQAGLLDTARRVAATGVRGVAEEAASAPGEEAQLVGHYRHLAPRHRAAVLDVVRGLDRSVPLAQLPPGGVLDPDTALQAERDSVRVHPETPPPDKITSDN